MSISFYWRRFGRLLVLGGTTLFNCAVVHAAMLAPGAKINLRFAAEPEDAQLVAQTNFAYLSGDFAGTLVSKVWEGDESNPWGGLTFSYRITSAAECSKPLGLFALLGFEDSLVDVNFAGSGVSPRTASRTEAGNCISFGFLDRSGAETLMPGSVSAWLVIQTSDTAWRLNHLIGLGAEEVPAITFVPAVVPEPTVVLLSCLAFGIVGGVRRRLN